jgi:dTDP-4-amino-4,6-dideoxygalactose transaminase
VLKAFVYWAMLRPRLYWIPNAVPQLGLGRTVFTTEFPLARANSPLVALALATIRHLDEFTRVRRCNASVLFEALREVPTVSVPQAEADSEPACLRFPVLMSDRRSRDAVVHSLNAAGIGATGSYPASLATVPELRPLIVGDTAALTAGQSVAERIVTLPTHPFVRTQDLSRMVSAIGADAAPAPQGMNLCVE